MRDNALNRQLRMLHIVAVLPIILLSFVVFLANNSLGQEENGIHFSKMSWVELLEESKMSGKPIYIDCYTSWCRPCKLMSNNVFTDSTVGQFYGEHFLCFKVDMEKGVGLDLKDKFSVNAFPTHLFVNSSEEVLHKSVGYKSVEQFLELGESALNPKTRLSYLNEEFDNGNYSSDFLAEYTIALRAANLEYRMIYDSYLTEFKGEKDSAYYAFLFNYTRSFDSKAFNEFFASTNELYKMYGGNYLEQRYLSILTRSVSQDGREGNANLFGKIIDFYQRNFVNPKIRTASEFHLEYLLKSSNYPVYYDSVKAYIEKYFLFDRTMEETRNLILTNPDSTYFRDTDDETVVTYFTDKGKGTLTMGGHTPEQGLTAIEYYNSTAYSILRKIRTFLKISEEHKNLTYKVITWLDLALLIDRNHSEEYGGLYKYLRTYADLYFSAGDYEKAYESCKRAIQCAEDINLPDMDYESMVEMLIKIENELEGKG